QAAERGRCVAAWIDFSAGADIKPAPRSSTRRVGRYNRRCIEYHIGTGDQHCAQSLINLEFNPKLAGKPVCSIEERADVVAMMLREFLLIDKDEAIPCSLGPIIGNAIIELIELNTIIAEVVGKLDDSGHLMCVGPHNGHVESKPHIRPPLSSCLSECG